MENNVALIDGNAKANIGTEREQDREGENVNQRPGQGNDSPKGSGAKSLQDYIAELKIYMESIPDPNEGRIEELRDLIRKGKLVTKEAVRETAEKLARQFVARSEW